MQAYRHNKSLAMLYRHIVGTMGLECEEECCVHRYRKRAGETQILDVRVNSVNIHAVDVLCGLSAHLKNVLLSRKKALPKY